MSGFLDHLIARGLGLEESIRPRARLLFEPQPAGATHITPAAPGDMEFEERDLAPDGRASSQTGAAVERNDRELARARLTAPRSPEQGTRAIEPVIRRTPVENAGDRARSFARPDLALDGNINPRAERAAFTQHPSNPRADGSSAMPPAALGKAPEDPRESAIILRAAAGASPSTGPQAAHAPPPPVVRPSAPIEPARSREQPRLASPLDQRRPPDWRRPAEREPVIHVTIGRIEVRAEQPSARPPAKERSVQKPMSLDEYLRRRTGRSGE